MSEHSRGRSHSRSKNNHNEHAKRASHSMSRSHSHREHIHSHSHHRHGSRRDSRRDSGLKFDNKSPQIVLPGPAVDPAIMACL